MVRWQTEDGLTVVAEPMAHAEVVSVGLFVRGGARLDPPGASGITHFLEHAVFRGSLWREGRQISRELDRRGAQMNGYTDREMTSFQADALAEDGGFVLDLLGELAFHPALDPEAVERERQVVLAEADEAEDDAEEQALEMVEAATWPQGAAGRPVVGLAADLRRLSARHLRVHHQATYRPDRMVLALAGRLPEPLRPFVEARLQGAAWQRPAPAGAFAAPAAGGEPVRVRRSIRELSQVHLAVAVRAPGRRQPGALATLLAAEALGGGPSSRLFERLREDQGLAYTVYAQAVQYTDHGLLLAYLSCAEEEVGRASRALARELRALSEEGLTAEEVERARGALRGGLMFGHETAAGRMARLGEEELLGEGARPLEERLRQLERLTPHEVSAVARTLGAAPVWSWAVVGPVEPDWLPGDAA